MSMSRSASGSLASSSRPGSGSGSGSDGLEQGSSAGFRVAAEQLVQLPEHEQLETLQVIFAFARTFRMGVQDMCHADDDLAWLAVCVITTWLRWYKCKKFC